MLALPKTRAVGMHGMRSGKRGVEAGTVHVAGHDFLEVGVGLKHAR